MFSDGYAFPRMPLYQASESPVIRGAGLFPKQSADYWFLEAGPKADDLNNNQESSSTDDDFDDDSDEDDFMI